MLPQRTQSPGLWLWWLEIQKGRGQGSVEKVTGALDLSQAGRENMHPQGMGCGKELDFQEEIIHG